MSNRQRKLDQKKLKGRGCRQHRGLAPRRGKGRTAHGHR